MYKRQLKDFGNFFKQIAVKIVVAIIVGINLSTSYGTFISLSLIHILEECGLMVICIIKVLRITGHYVSTLLTYGVEACLAQGKEALW